MIALVVEIVKLQIGLGVDMARAPIRFNVRVEDRDLGFNRIMSDLRDVGKSELVVGVLDGEPPYPDGTSVSDVAFMNEFGTDEVVDRPFIRPAFDDNALKWRKQLQRAFSLRITKPNTAKAVLHELGKDIRAAIKKNIVDKKDPPNSPETIAIKGFDDPLIDTRRLLRSIKFRVRPTRK